MKNIVTLILVFISNLFYSQIINFPDINFKNKLLASTTTNYIAQDSNLNSIKIDVNNNNEIEVIKALQVYRLDVSSSNITSLQGLSSFINLDMLICKNNQITSIDFNTNINLTYIDCSNNLLTQIDTSSILDLSYGLVCDNNLLTYLNLKGINHEFYSATIYFLSYENNPNLSYICVRGIDTNFVLSLYNVILFKNQEYGLTNCEVNTYCSFTPGGTYYTVQGVTKYDLNNDGCNVNDNNFSNLKINLTNGSNSGSLIANSSGNYSISVGAGTHTITPVLENPNYFTISPNTINVSFPSSSSPFNQNFCITPNGVHNDLSVELMPQSIAKPGFDLIYKIKYINKGTHLQSGSINFTYDDSVLDVVSTSSIPSTSILNLISFNFINLQPFETREIIIVLNLNSSMETPSVNSGNVLNFSSSIIGLVDETPSDNVIEVNQTVVNSFDPNDKTCLEGTIISTSKIGDYIHYMVRFENNGTANAQNVVIKDTIDNSKFEVSTLQFVDSSHTCITRITNGNIIEFIFEDINLSFNDQTNDGYIVFKLKSKNTLISGDQISNNANIYFDYNAPIITNTAISTFQTLFVEDFDLNVEFKLSPVPTRDVLNLNYNNKIEISSIKIYNLIGQLIQVVDNTSNPIIVSNLNSGCYLLTIESDKGTVSKKFIKD